MITSTIRNEPTSRIAFGAPKGVDVTSKPLQILVVDDNEDSAEAIALMLQCFGHDVQVAHSGEAAMEQMQRGQFDVVLLDLSLPDMHGTAVAERMRATGFKGKLIAVSGYSETSVKERCSRAGMDHFIVKPCSIHALRTLL
jgi:CheY-like chemotaxis protein